MEVDKLERKKEKELFKILAISVIGLIIASVGIGIMGNSRATEPDDVEIEIDEELDDEKAVFNITVEEPTNLTEIELYVMDEDESYTDDDLETSWENESGVDEDKSVELSALELEEGEEYWYTVVVTCDGEEYEYDGTFTFGEVTYSGMIMNSIENSYSLLLENWFTVLVTIASSIVIYGFVKKRRN